MMVSKIFSAALQGLEARIIEVEVASSQGLRAFNIVGLADAAIKEAKERVSSAIKSAGLKSPQGQAKRVIVNLAPADLKKQGALYDLPIALGCLLSSKQARFNPQDKIILGELALDGQLKPIKGAFLFALLAKEKNFNQIILPKENAQEAALLSLMQGDRDVPVPTLSPSCPQVIGVENLKQALAYLEGRTRLEPTIASLEELKPKKSAFEVEFGWVKGQNHTKRGLIIAAAGGHNLMMQGPPGAGKTILAKALTSILPPLAPEEFLDLTKIYSACGLLSFNNPIVKQRPFRNPHHTASEPSLIGGGSPPRPGEITLAHRGVLFMDEFPEFHRDVLESLRQPLEDGIINIQRANQNLTLPAKFALVAAANPCPCGYYNDPERECSCTSSQIASYRRKLSGPLIDRFDIFCWVPAVKYHDLVAPSESQETKSIRQEIIRARQVQKQRFLNQGILTNSEIRLPHIKQYCQIDGQSHNLLRQSVDSGNLSARGYHRVLKVARTIADLEARKNIGFDDVSEALSYRQREND